MARGEAPSLSSGEVRVALTRLMTYCLIAWATCTPRTAAMRARMSLPCATGSSWSSGDDDPCESSIESSASGSGYPMEMRAVKRSRCASGNG